MPLLDAGLFLIMSAIGFAFMFVRGFAALKIISVVIFFGLAVALLADYDVAFTASSTDGVTTTSETKFLIDANSNWLGWVYIILGTVSVGIFFTDVVRR